MTKDPRGWVLVINIEQFSDACEEHQHRAGSSADVDAITKLFEELYFNVEHKHNLDEAVLSK